MMRWARAVSFQRLGSSAWVFSSASRALALSKSKVPPQQPDRLLDVGDHGLHFSAHDEIRSTAGDSGSGEDVTIVRGTRNPRTSLIPAKAGIQPCRLTGIRGKVPGPRFRGDERT